MRVWAERGDYSELSEERILHPPKDQEHTREDEDARPAVEDIRALQETMIHNLACGTVSLIVLPSSSLDLTSPSLAAQPRPRRAHHRPRPSLRPLSPA